MKATARLSVAMRHGASSLSCRHTPLIALAFMRAVREAFNAGCIEEETVKTLHVLLLPPCGVSLSMEAKTRHLCLSQFLRCALSWLQISTAACVSAASDVMYEDEIFHFSFFACFLLVFSCVVCRQTRDKGLERRSLFFFFDLFCLLLLAASLFVSVQLGLSPSTPRAFHPRERPSCVYPHSSGAKLQKRKKKRKP